jgi:hypothetical protein
MSGRRRLEVRIATQPWEFEQLHCLNYRTFVEEIPQQPANPDGRLVDRYHPENTYLVAVVQRQDGERIVGMVAYRARRPFSLDRKLARLDDYLPTGCSPCEIRLLAVTPEYRRSRVCATLLESVGALAMERGHDVALISATVRQLRLYTHLGFTPFGPLVGTDAAPYQPMLLTQDRYEARRARRRPLSLPNSPDP